MVMLTGGNNIGRIGILENVDKHPGSYDIAKIKDVRGHRFSTRLSNILCIGDGKTASISLPAGEGIKYSLLEQMKMEDDREEEADEGDDQ